MGKKKPNMFLRFFIISMSATATLYYLHEYHTDKFMAVTRQIPFLTPFFVKLHQCFMSSNPPCQNTEEKDKIVTEKLFTLDDLALYNGAEDSLGIYISILGNVFDVEKGKRFYGPGGSYQIFAGRDATRSFITGDFSVDKASDDIMDLALADLLSLETWVSLYKSDYKYLGKLVGRYFTETGEKTEYHLEVDRRLEEARAEQRDQITYKMNFPPCNMEWDALKGSKVWCSPRSGGVERDWVGVPRKMYEIGTETSRCVCVNLEDLDRPGSPQNKRRKHIEKYLGCDALSNSCIIDK